MWKKDSRGEPRGDREDDVPAVQAVSTEKGNAARFFARPVKKRPFVYNATEGGPNGFVWLVLMMAGALALGSIDWPWNDGPCEGVERTVDGVVECVEVDYQGR